MLQPPAKVGDTPSVRIVLGMPSGVPPLRIKPIQRPILTDGEDRWSVWSAMVNPEPPFAFLPVPANCALWKGSWGATNAYYHASGLSASKALSTDCTSPR
jgi:hypothetical protein